jgi:hypothetical protein
MAEMRSNASIFHTGIRSVLLNRLCFRCALYNISKCNQSKHQSYSQVYQHDIVFLTL